MRHFLDKPTPPLANATNSIRVTVLEWLATVSVKSRWLAYSLFFAGGIATATLLHSFLLPHLNHAARKAPAAPVTASDPDRNKPGGHVQALELPFADSDDLFPDRAARLAPPRWFFENFTARQLADFLSNCDLSETQKNELIQKSAWLGRLQWFLGLSVAASGPQPQQFSAREDLCRAR